MKPNYEEFIERYNNPFHRGRIRGGEHSEMSNFSCGDYISMYIKVGKDSRIEDAKFEGKGCALSIATADMICDYVIGKKLNVICDLDFDKATEIIGFVPSVGRVGCVKIVVDALQDVCRNYGARGKKNTKRKAGSG